MQLYSSYFVVFLKVVGVVCSPRVGGNARALGYSLDRIGVFDPIGISVKRSTTCDEAS
jgi:hypothetical protein